MPGPVTTIDTRYSDPGAVPVAWPATEAILAAAELFWLSTVRAVGRPHVTPVVAVWVEGAVWFGTGSSEQKFLNLGANPHVVLTTGANQWDQGIDVVVEGNAARVTDHAVLARVAAAFTTKWDGRWQYSARDGCFTNPDMGGEVMVFAVTPVKVFAHAKGDPFGATTHRFIQDEA
jgi:general stress protein 26